MWQKIWTNRLIVLILLAVGLRAYFIVSPAHPYDIGTYQAWGEQMLSRGPQEFFTSTWSDYLPLPIYLTAAIVSLSHLTSLPFSLLFKSTLVLVELLLLLVLYHKQASSRSRLLIVLLLFLSPAAIIDGSLWGQLDVLPSLLALLSFYFLSHRLLPGLMFGLALATKPIFILLAPLLGLLSLRRQTLLSNTLATLSTVLLTALPVVPGVGVVKFLWNKIFEQASTYPYQTINAFNFWNLGNSEGLWLPDNVSYLGISAHALGLAIFLGLAFVTVSAWRSRGYNPRFRYRVAASLLLFFYTFTTRMHERHLFFGIPFLALAAFYKKYLLIPYLLFTICLSLNMWSAYYWVIHSQTWPISSFVSELISWIVTLTSLSLLVWDWRSLWLNLKSWVQKNILLLIILLFASCLRLVALGHPPVYIFDEVYHAFTAREYLHNNTAAWEWWTTPPPGVAYEWTHPPLAKYGMGLSMLVFGENSFGWRLPSALMGIASIGGAYALMYELFQRRRPALLAALLLSIEGISIAQSRIAMNDIYMLALLLWSLVFALRSKWKQAALLYGLSLASKWSALYGILPLASIYLHHLLSRRVASLRTFLAPLRLLAISLLVYLVTYIPFLLAGHTLQELIELHRQMWYYHTHLSATHDYQSLPWEWMLAARPVWYYVEYTDRVANIYVQGNPLLLWLGLSSLFATLSRARRFPYLLLLVGYLSLVVPWFFSPRIMFFYHYLPSATFATLSLAVWLERLSPRLLRLTLILCFLSFTLVAPLLYGIGMPPWYDKTLFEIFPSWK